MKLVFGVWGQNPIRQPGNGPQKFMGSSVNNFWWQKFRPPETGSGRFLGLAQNFGAPWLRPQKGQGVEGHAVC